MGCIFHVGYPNMVVNNNNNDNNNMLRLEAYYVQKSIGHIWTKCLY